MNRPKALTCYLCGQGFGTASLAIHQPQCYRKKAAQWEIGDLRTRGPRPVDPATRGSPTPSTRKGKGALTGADIDRFNEEQYSGFVESLAPCPHCGRRFNPQSLAVHLRSCRPGNTAMPVKGRHGISNEGSQGRPLGSGGRYEEPMDSSPELAGLIPCRKCGRRFVGDRIAIHENACLRMRNRKRFDSHKQRAKGTDIDTARRTTRQQVQKPASIWRQQHKDFIQAIRYARRVDKVQASGKSLAYLPPPPPSLNPDYIQCPHCSRRFNPMAAERHIPSCATTMNKPKPPPGMRHISPNPMSRTSPHPSPMQRHSSASPAARHLSPGSSMASANLASAPAHHTYPSPSRPTQQMRPKSTANRSPAHQSHSANQAKSPSAVARPRRSSIVQDAHSHDHFLVPPNAGQQPHDIHLTNPRQCHHCGSSYPQNTAKFCTECGTKRSNASPTPSPRCLTEP